MGGVTVAPQVAMQSLWNIKVVVLVKPEHENRISHVGTSSVKTGIANTLGRGHRALGDGHVAHGGQGQVRGGPSVCVAQGGVWVCIARGGVRARADIPNTAPVGTVPCHQGLGTAGSHPPPQGAACGSQGIPQPVHVPAGNKGAVGISFMFNGTSFGFVNCHLTSGSEKTAR